MNRDHYKTILDQAPDAILYADREGIIRLWNRGAELVFGHSAQEATGQSLDLIIPERLRGRHWEGYFKVMETGVSRYGIDRAGHGRNLATLAERSQAARA